MPTRAGLMRQWKCTRAIIKQNENNYSLLLEFGNLCFRTEEFDEALRTFKKLSVLKPQRVEGWNNLGIVQVAYHEDESALESFKKVLELSPTTPERF